MLDEQLNEMINDKILKQTEDIHARKEKEKTLQVENKKKL